MVDPAKQRVVLLEHLAYYNQVLPHRSAEYNQLKRTIVIPRIHVALAKIKEGTYGICLDCGDTIPDKRLELIPGALRCVTCQKESET